MNKKFDFFDLLAILIGGFLFAAYYLLMSEFFKLDPFKGVFLILTIYFIISIFTMPYAYGKVYEKLSKNAFATSITYMSLSFLLGPIILIYSLINKKSS